jgi:anti-anti-sigma regulatory factor
VLAKTTGVECIITREAGSGDSVIRVSGALSAAQVPDLLEACAAPGGTVVTLDLADLVSADALGLHTLRRLMAQGVQLVHASRHIRLRLNV